MGQDVWIHPPIKFGPDPFQGVWEGLFFHFVNDKVSEVLICYVRVSWSYGRLLSPAMDARISQYNPPEQKVNFLQRAAA